MQSCNHKDDPVKPKPIDTCEGRRNLVPEIIIYENRAKANSPVLVKDTVLTANDISFEAPEGFSEYSWRIGDDEREFNVRKISFRFLEPWGFLSLRLIVKYPLECFNYPKEYDTLYRSIYIKHLYKAKIMGEYLGAHDDNPNDTFSVRIKIRYQEEIGRAHV